MKRKFTLLAAALMLLSCLAVPLGMRADEASYVFNTDAGIAALGISKPSQGAGTNLAVLPTTYDVGQISMGVTNGTGTDTRVWNSSGTLDLRIYNGSSFTFSAADGYNITSIVLAGNTVNGFNANEGSFSSGSWSNGTTGATSVTLTATGTEKINTITVTYTSTGGGTDPSLSVSPATISFGNKAVGSTSSESFTVTYANLTINETVSLTGTSTTDCTISPASFNVDASGSGSKTVTVTYTPQSAGTLNGSIIVAEATDNMSETVTVTGVAKVAHNITISSMTNGSVTADKSTAIEGETITLTVAPSAGYSTSSLTVVGDNSGDAVTVTNNQFTMPNEAVTVSATFESTLVDVLNRTFTGVTGTSYVSWSNKSGSASEAVYAGNSAGGTNNSGPCIQIRTTNSNSGIVSTTSGGKVKKVTVVWNDETANSSNLDIYGKNTAYSAASDLYSNSTQGTKIGSITKGTSTELNIIGDYKFIGIRSNSGARYLDEIDITWQPSLIKNPTFSPDGGAFVSTQNVTISCETADATIYYTTDGSTPDANSTLYESPISLSTTTTLKAIAIKGNDSSEVVTAEFTFLTPKVSIEEIYAVATSTSTPIAITFNNWVVSGNNGGTTPTQAYLSDNTEYGCVIYNTSGHGFVAGNILNGTVVCNVKTYTSYGYTYVQLENLTTGTSGLTVTTGGTATSTVTTISGLSAQNVGAVFTLKDITYKGSNYFQDDATNNINLSTTLYTPSPSLTSGKLYDITGVFTVSYESNSTYKRTNPRFAADIVLKANMSLTDFSGLTEFTYVVNNGPSAKQEIDVYGTDFASSLTVTASSDYEVSLDDVDYLTSVVLEPDASKAAGDITQTVYVRLKKSLNTGEHDGTLTFTADNLTTKVVNLEGNITASATYTITLNQTSGGTISADKLVAEAGEKITLSADFDDDCTEVKVWTVLDGTANTIPVTNNQFTMPASNVEVGATFGTKSFTMSYSVNGTIEDFLEEDVDCGDDATIYTASDLDEIVDLPTGFAFNGWSTSASSTETIANFKPTDDATLYAVLIPEGASVSYVRITSLSEITEGTYFIVNDGYVLPSATTSSSPVKSNTYKIETPLAASYNSLPVAGTEWIFTGTNDEMTIKNSEGKYLYATNNNAGLRVGSTSDTWAFEDHPRAGVTCDFAMKDANNNRYCASYATGTADDWRSYTSANHGNYGDYGILYLYKKETPAAYTLVEEITSTTATLPSIEPSYLITVKSGGVLTLTGPNNGDASNLIIEDGGQLKVYATGAKDGEVQATVEKNIDAWTSGTTGGWYFISSPINVSNLDPNTVANMLPADEVVSSETVRNYDLYWLDNTMWRNYRKNSFNLANGQGYLYARSEAATLEFAGAVKPYDANHTISVSAGWNLIGNPYTFNAYPNTAYYTINDANEGITPQTGTTSAVAVAPCTGIIVKAENTGSVKFLDEAPNVSINNGNIRMTLAQQATERGTASTLDNAIVSFNEGNQLEKFYFMEQNANLSIPQNGKDYAIVSTEAQGEMPVSFRANENGQYTLTVNAENVEMNYLHLIDNMTGADIDLLQTPSYTFNAKTYDYESRFRLVFAANNEDGDSTSSASFAFFANGNLIINNEGNATLQVIDALGRILSNESISGTVSKRINAPAGVYVLRLINGENVKTQKIVVR